MQIDYSCDGTRSILVASHGPLIGLGSAKLPESMVDRRRPLQGRASGGDPARRSRLTHQRSDRSRATLRSPRRACGLNSVRSRSCGRWRITRTCFGSIPFAVSKLFRFMPIRSRRAEISGAHGGCAPGAPVRSRYPRASLHRTKRTSQVFFS